MKLPEPKNPVDFNEIDARLAANVEVHLQKWFPGKKIVRTGDWFAIGTHGSLKVHSAYGHWTSFETEDKGPGLLSLYSWNLGRPIREAALEFSDEVLPPVTRKPEPPLPGHPQGEPSQVYQYRDEAGRLKGAVLRFDQGDSKTFRQAALVDGVWQWQGMAEPRPLYGVENLRLHPQAQVIITEGEKAADALRAALPDALVLTWPGGSSNVDKTDWKPLEGRAVTVWPDNDDPGIKAAKKVREHLPEASILDVSNLGPKQDAADVVDVWTAEQLREFIGARQAKSLFEKLQIRKFDPANLASEKEPIISLRGCPALFAGNLAALVGSEKSGKSHVIAAAARAITAPGSRQLGFESSAGGRIVYLDFEQDRSDFESLILRSGIDAERVSAYHLTGFMPHEARAALSAIAENEQGLVAILLDGYADLVSDPNDQSEANSFVAEMMGLAERKQIAILGILHLNPGSEEKSRGHLGSQLGRKCQTIFSIKALKDGTRILYTAKARKRPVLESEGICFVWSDSARGFIEMQETPRDIRAAEQRSDFEQTLRKIQDLTGMRAWRNAELCEAIQQVELVKKRTAQSRVKAFCDRGLLAHCATRGIYTSKLEGANDPK